MSAADLEIIRFCRSERMGVFSTLTLPGGWNAYTCERPWLDNRPDVSCIPAGVYTLHWAPSNLMATHWPDLGTHAWHFMDVPERTEILLHPGNVLIDSKGCVLAGASLGQLWKDGQLYWSVTDSVATIKRIHERLDPTRDYTVDVRWLYPPEYP